MKTCKTWLAAAALMATTSATYATPVFQGRLADGSASSTCTVSGATKCAMFYDTTLDITILNNWDIGKGTWSASAAPGSAQALAASAGLTASGLSGWVLPTGDGFAAEGPLNQYLSIWNSVGGTYAGLSGQFDGVRPEGYWSSTVYAQVPSSSWTFEGGPSFGDTNFPFLAVAVRPGDVAASVPEPQTLALVLLALGAALVANRRRSR